MPGTVHRLERVAFAPALGTRIDLVGVALAIGGQEHVLAEIVPVARGMPQLVLEDLRRDHLVEAVAPVEAAHVVDQLVVDDRALGQEKRRARAKSDRT